MTDGLRWSRRPASSRCGAAPVTAPNTDSDFWIDATAFFRQGRSGAWREILRSDDEIRRYDERVATLGPPDLLEWLHRS